jgi:hypothetical protein
MIAARRKPLDYRERRKWQDAERAAGRVPECGREACTQAADPAWTNQGTPLLYCAACAKEINRFNPGLCRPEVGRDPRIDPAPGDVLRTRGGRRRVVTPNIAFTLGEITFEDDGRPNQCALWHWRRDMAEAVVELVAERP